MCATYQRVEGFLGLSTSAFVVRVPSMFKPVCSEKPFVNNEWYTFRGIVCMLNVQNNFTSELQCVFHLQLSKWMGIPGDLTLQIKVFKLGTKQMKTRGKGIWGHFWSAVQNILRNPLRDFLHPVTTRYDSEITFCGMPAIIPLILHTMDELASGAWIAERECI